jgi:hypothetical protein
MLGEITVTDAMTGITVAAATSGIGAVVAVMAGGITIMVATAVAATATSAMAATATVVGLMTAAAIPGATATIVTVAAMATGATAAITTPPADRVSPRRAVAITDANDGGSGLMSEKPRTDKMNGPYRESSNLGPDPWATKSAQARP